MGWCDAMVVLCLVLREVLGCASHQPSFSGVGLNASLPPTFPPLKESLKWVKSWHCLCFTWGHGFTPLVVGAKQPSCPLYTRVEAILCAQQSGGGTCIAWINPHAWAMPAVASPDGTSAAGSTEGPRPPSPAPLTSVVAAAMPTPLLARVCAPHLE